MPFVSDSFTGTDGTLLEAHTGETGATWTEHPSYATGALAISNANRLRPNTSTISCYYASGVPAAPDYDVVGLLRQVSATGSMGVVGRVSTSVNTMYLARYNSATADWALFAIVAGAVTTLGTFAEALSNGNERTVTLRMRGTSIKMLIDGVERVSATDSTITAAGRAGIRGATGTNTTGFHLDSISAANVLSGSGSVAGTGSITGSATRKVIAAAPVAGTGAITGAATRQASAVAYLSGTGAVQGAATRTTFVNSSPIAGAGSIVCTATRSATANASVAGAGAVAATATTTVPWSYSLDDQPSFTYTVPPGFSYSPADGWTYSLDDTPDFTYSLGD